MNFLFINLFALILLLVSTSFILYIGCNMFGLTVSKFKTALKSYTFKKLLLCLTSLPTFSYISDVWTQGFYFSHINACACTILYFVVISACYICLRLNYKYSI